MAFKRKFISGSYRRAKLGYISKVVFTPDGRYSNQYSRHWHPTRSLAVRRIRRAELRMDASYKRMTTWEVVPSVMRELEAPKTVQEKPPTSKNKYRGDYIDMDEIMGIKR